MGVHFWGTLTLCYLLHYKFHFSVVASIAGTILGMMSSAVNIMLNHSQLIFIGALPALGIFAFGFFENSNKAIKRWLPYACAFFLWFGLIFFIAFYVAYFAIIIGICLGGLYLLIQGLCKKHPLVIMKNFVQNGWKGILVCAGICSAWGIPFLMIYLPSQKHFGGRYFNDVLSMLPQWFNLVNASLISVC